MGRPHSALYGLSIKYIATTCGVSLKTAARWKSGTTCPGLCELAMLERDLGVWDPAWRGWVLRRGKLISPEGLESTPGEVRGIPYMSSVIATYQAEFRRLRDEADGLEEQPEATEEFPAIWGITA